MNTYKGFEFTDWVISKLLGTLDFEGQSFDFNLVETSASARRLDMIVKIFPK